MDYIVSSPPGRTKLECFHAELDADEASLSKGLAPFCPRHWDHLLCWPLTPVNVTSALPCNASKSFVDIVTASRPAIDTGDIPGLAYLKCDPSGGWESKTNYEECMKFLNEIFSEEETRRKVRHAVSIITFGLCLTSTVLLLVALGIFTFFKSLNCDRLRIHVNFMISLVIRYAVSLLWYEPFIYGEEHPKVWFKDIGQEHLCKVILMLLMYGNTSPVFWMFIEGVYLHSRVVTEIFDSPAPFKLYYLIGWVLPGICVLSWAATMIAHEESCDVSSCQANTTCWEGYTDQPYLFIISVPMIVALAINLLFLVNIVRIVATQVRNRHGSGIVNQPPENAHFKKAIRATVILFPLLGITNLLFFINPKNGTQEKIYMLFNASMQSSQGIFLAVLYCFCSSEVQDTIRRHVARVLTRNEARRSATMNSIRFNNRATAATTKRHRWRRDTSSSISSNHRLAAGLNRPTSQAELSSNCNNNNNAAPSTAGEMRRQQFRSLASRGDYV